MCVVVKSVALRLVSQSLAICFCWRYASCRKVGSMRLVAIIADLFLYWGFVSRVAIIADFFQKIHRSPECFSI